MTGFIFLISNRRVQNFGKYESSKVRCLGMPPESMQELSVCCAFSNPILEVRNFETSIFWDASRQPLSPVSASQICEINLAIPYIETGSNIHKIGLLARPVII